MILRAFDRRQLIEGFIDHFEPVIELAQVKLKHGVLRIMLERFLIDTDDFARFSLLQEQLFQSVEDNHAACLCVDLLQDLDSIFRLAFMEQDLTEPDVGRQEAAVLLDRATEIPAGFVRMAAFEQLPADFVCAPDQERFFGLFFGVGQMSFQQAMLDLQRLAPLL